MKEARIISSEQYDLPCVVVEDTSRISADDLIAKCESVGAVRRVDGIEYVVQLRHDVGPELWTENSLRRSVGSLVAGEPIPEKLVRIEYETPPLRAIYETYYADNDEPQEVFEKAFAELNPHSLIRKIERGVPPAIGGKGGCS